MAAIGVPLINGVAYSHADVLLNILGVPMIGLTAIEYSDMQDITPNYSTGQQPTSVGFGNVKYSARITLTMESIEALQKVAPAGKLQNIPFFDIGVNFVPEGGVLVRHVLKRCRFKGRSQSSATNNSQIEVALELFLADISYTG